jgi:hypothetical protein
MHVDANQREPSMFFTSVLVVVVLAFGGGVIAGFVALFR